MNSQEVASLAKISVRTLHYYDKIGLLVPHRNEWNDYREYSEADLAKLQQICFFKTCGFSLLTIQKLLTSDTFDKSEAFQLQKAYLLRERERIDIILETLERSISEMKGEISMTQAEKFKGFDFTSEDPFKAEAIARWGYRAVSETDAKLETLSQGDKQDLSEKLTALFEDLARLQDEPPASKNAQEAIDRMYHILNTTLGYHYTLDAFAGLGQLYLEDTRFTENLRQYGERLPEFLAEAMTIYSGQHAH